MSALIAGGVAAAAVIGGAIIGGNASKRAAQAQANASIEAARIQQQIFNQQRADEEPWRVAGANALSQMQNPMFQQSFDGQNFQADPGYQFRMQQGQQAIERSAAARGGLNSGATMKALDRFGQGIGSDEYQKVHDRFNSDQSLRFGRLGTLAGFGQAANSQNAADGNAYAANVGQNQANLGNAQSAGIMGQANALSQGISGAANGWMNYQMMNKMFSPSSGGGGNPGLDMSGVNTPVNMNYGSRLGVGSGL